MIETFIIAWHFMVARWGRRYRDRAALLAMQRRKLDAFLAELVKRSPYYAGREPTLESLPVITKHEHLANYASLNAAGITLDEATTAALRAERERDFQPQVRGLTVGLSSGTTGEHSVFLVSKAERCRWAGRMLARLLSAESLRQVLTPWREPLRIAFFLRASSNLYTTVQGTRVKFGYYDLTRSFDQLVAELDEQRPHVLVAPATVLTALAARTTARPSQVVSVAEVLDGRDRERIEAVFGVRVQEVYQAAEGFLGVTCEQGRMHLNEEWLCVEPEWLDERRERFYPVITDFSRETQWIVRYRLNDILRLADGECACGRASVSLRAIEGRAEEVLWARGKDGAWMPVFPDVVRQAVYAMTQPVGLWRVMQEQEVWWVESKEGDATATQVVEALKGMLQRMSLEVPLMQRRAWQEQPPGEKMKRIRCIQKPA